MSEATNNVLRVFREREGTVFLDKYTRERFTIAELSAMIVAMEPNEAEAWLERFEKDVPSA
jgi:hypothetical protein